MNAASLSRRPGLVLFYCVMNILVYSKLFPVLLLFYVRSFCVGKNITPFIAVIFCINETKLRLTSKNMKPLLGLLKKYVGHFILHISFHQMKSVLVLVKKTVNLPSSCHTVPLYKNYPLLWCVDDIVMMPVQIYKNGYVEKTMRSHAGGNFLATHQANRI